MRGGCLCGAVRYRLTRQPTGAGWCHCRNCQLNSGSPAMAFASIAIADLQIETGADKLGHFVSSVEAERQFCTSCGTPLWVQDRENPLNADFSLTTLDDPEAIHPEFHIYYGSHISWAPASDDLPRFPSSRSQGKDV